MSVRNRCYITKRETEQFWLPNISSMGIFQWFSILTLYSVLHLLWSLNGFRPRTKSLAHWQASGGIANPNSSNALWRFDMLLNHISLHSAMVSQSLCKWHPSAVPVLVKVSKHPSKTMPFSSVCHMVVCFTRSVAKTLIPIWWTLETSGRNPVIMIGLGPTIRQFL